MPATDRLRRSRHRRRRDPLVLSCGRPGLMARLGLERGLGRRAIVLALRTIVPLVALVFFFLLLRRPPGSTLFPTRRSSDLSDDGSTPLPGLPSERAGSPLAAKVTSTPSLYQPPLPAKSGARSGLALGALGAVRSTTTGSEDRKSTRLNSSHANISYAVFCLK